MRTTEIMNNRSSEDPRWAKLRPPTTAGSPLTRRRFLAGTGIVLTGPALLASCGTTRADRGEAQPAGTTRVHLRLIDAQIGKPTPAMACISDAGSGEVRLPPDGRLCAKPSTVRQFYAGVQFNPDPNWIGPVRKMQGKGDNDDRSFVYEDRPSIPDSAGSANPSGLLARMRESDLKGEKGCAANKSGDLFRLAR